MSYVMVDVESDGPISGDYSLVCFGALIVEPGLGRSFYARLKPISDRWLPEALAVSGFTREETLGFDDPHEVMARFAAWLADNGGKRATFISDNNGFDWQFINWYFHHFSSGIRSGQLAEPGLALQGAREGHVPNLQAPPEESPHARPGRRRPRQRRGTAPHEAGDGLKIALD